jgi:hypothetical protein
MGEVYAVAYYDHGETVLLFYGTYEEAHSNLISALAVDPTAKMKYPNGMPEDRVQNALETSEDDYMAREFEDMEMRGTEPRAADYDESDLPF